MLNETPDNIIEKTDIYKESKVRPSMKHSKSFVINQHIQEIKIDEKVKNDNSRRKNQKIDNTKTKRLQKLIEENSKKYADSLKEDPVP